MATERQCGDCGLCCKLVGIGELCKPVHQWCPHWSKNKQCDIYESRPEECRTFACLWLAGELPERLSPRKTRVVAMRHEDGRTMLFADRGISDPMPMFAEAVAMKR